MNFTASQIKHHEELLISNEQINPLDCQCRKTAAENEVATAAESYKWCIFSIGTGLGYSPPYLAKFVEFRDRYRTLTEVWKRRKEELEQK